MILYIFISHQKKLLENYSRIATMMYDDFIVVSGGYLKDEYDENTKILKLNCNDGYIGLSEKVIKTFHFILSNNFFEKYTHFIKLDDDMRVINRFDHNEIKSLDYFGTVNGLINEDEYDRRWHMGKTGTYWDNTPYLGEYKPYCAGGLGYGISRRALTMSLPNFDYITNIYEDVNIGILMDKHGIQPTNIDNLDTFLKSPVHS